MKKLGLKASVLGVTIMALAACGGPDVPTQTVTGDYMNGATAKFTYDAFDTVLFDTLDYHKTQEATNSNHIANFVDGLLTNDQYGRLVKALASNVTHSDDWTEFTFTIRENVPWMTYDGQQYKNSAGEPQFVKAEDWITTAKRVLDYATMSDTSFMVTMFIEGTKEYQAYTYVQYLIATNPTEAQRLRTDAQKAIRMQTYIRDNFNEEVTISADDVTPIGNFERVGIRVNGQGQLVYSLSEPANFFPTMLTYSPFLPTNADFLAAHANDFGNGADDILYCGPYLLQQSDDSQIVYKKNNKYWNVDMVHVDTVTYHIISTEQATNENTARVAFENGEIDGFTLNSKDIEGWNKYIAGPDGTGTLQDPYDPIVNSRFYDNISYTWLMTLNINRPNLVDGGTSADAQSSELSDAELHNTNLALSIQEVRELLLRSLDFSVYNRRHGEMLEEQQQVQLNTLVPENFVFDDTDTDYTDYYYEHYASEEGMTTEEAKEKLAPGQYDGVNLTLEEVAVLRERAEKAIELYNQQNPLDPIRLPIKVEQLSLGGFSDDSMREDTSWANSLNNRANGCTVRSGEVSEDMPLCEGSQYPLLRVINNDNFTSQDNWTQAANAAYGHLNVWGWQADYGDPLSYLNIYTTGGDMAFTTGTDSAVDGYRLNADGTALEYMENILAEYDQIVRAGREEYQDYVSRFSYFAEAEYMLLNEIYICLPLYNQGQGYRASISNAIGYESPSAGYGLSTSKLIGMWVLLDPPSGEQRQEMVQHFETLKAQAIAETGNVYIYDYQFE